MKRILFIQTEELETMSTSDAVEMTAHDIIPRLNKDTVTDLVLVSMLALPDSLPSHFHDTYTPIAAAGGQAQVVHLARLLATQMNAARIGKGYERMEALRKVNLFCECTCECGCKKIGGTSFFDCSGS